MPAFLVKAKLKPGVRAVFDARLADATIAEGAPYQDALVAALRSAHFTGDSLYFMLESRNDSLRGERQALAEFMDVTSVLPVNEVVQAGVDDDEDDD